MRRALLPVVLLAAAVIAGSVAWLADRSSDSGTAEASAATPAAATPVLSPRRVPTLLVEPSADAALADQLADIAGRSPEGSCLVVTRDGRTVFAHNPERWMTPASTQKILTSAAALEVLGPDHAFTTEVRSTADIGPDGVLDGDVWLIGAGDPVLDTADYLTRFPTARPRTDIERLADELVGAGLAEVRGAVLGDESRYDAERTVASWSDSIIAANRAGPLSALMVNDGFASWPTDSPDNTDASASSDPAAHAAGVLDDLLEERGVSIDGGAGSGVVPDGTRSLAAAVSPSLTELLEHLNTFSDNTTAEQLLKELGAAAGDLGSTAGGAGVVAETLADIGAATVGVADGSGLSRDNITTCTTLTTALDHHGPESPLAESLAVAGETGTLADRFLDQSTSGRILAKSGSLDEVDALAGMARTRSDRSLTFAYIINGAVLDPTVIPQLQQDMATALVEWPDGPDLDEVAPG
ncbi:MAG: D-alanyl-D-alanine carboxypeptidase/D-alanyl-D-alanine-endopeptidase [Acidimicrobiia bacterium]|nr:D-alanyl-D-alanine carboxypeptidase/D-alanyl-D-alanine-endopeptidase [Acidimicrobiia bacterium]